VIKQSNFFGVPPTGDLPSDRRQKGVATKGGHFEEYYGCIDKICEL